MTGPFGFTSYELLNDEKVKAALIRAAMVSSDLRTPFAQIARDFQKSRKAIFALQSAGQYPDLSTRPFMAWWEPKNSTLHRLFTGGYKEYKEAKWGFAYPILLASGRLERSVTDPQHPENITRIDKFSLEMGTSTPYAVYHQSDAARKKIPLRKFLFVGPESLKYADKKISGFPERCLNTLNSYVIRKLGGSMQEATGRKPRIKKENKI